MGLSLTLAREEVLRRPDMFGKFGRLLRVLVNKSHPYNADAPGGPSISAYIQYYRESDASAAARQMNNEVFDGREIRCSIATTKYCDSYIARAPKQSSMQMSAYPVTCGNPDCLYYHEAAPPGDVLTVEEVNARQLGPPPPAYLFQLRRRHVTAKGVVTRPAGMSPPSMRPTRTSGSPPPMRPQNGAMGTSNPTAASAQSFYRTASRPSVPTTSQGVGKRRNSSYERPTAGIRSHQPQQTANISSHSSSYRQFPGKSGPRPGVQGHVPTPATSAPPRYDKFAGAAPANNSLPSLTSRFESSNMNPITSSNPPTSLPKPHVVSSWAPEPQPAAAAASTESASLKDLLAKIGGGRGNGNGMARPSAGVPVASFTPAAPRPMRGDSVIDTSKLMPSSDQERMGMFSQSVGAPRLENQQFYNPVLGAKIQGEPENARGPGRSRFPFAHGGGIEQVARQKPPSKSRFNFASGRDSAGSSAAPQATYSADDAVEKLLSAIDLSAPRETPTPSKIHEEFRENESIIKVSPEFDCLSAEQKLASIFADGSQKSKFPKVENLKIQNLNELGKTRQSQARESKGAGKGKKKGEKKGDYGRDSSFDQGNFLGGSLASEGEDYMSSDNVEAHDGERKLTRTQRRKREKKARQRERREKRAAAAAQGKKTDEATANGGAVLSPIEEVGLPSDVAEGVTNAPTRYDDLLMPPVPVSSNPGRQDVSAPLAALRAFSRKHGELERTLSMTELEQEVEAAREREAALQTRLSELQQRIRTYDNIRT